MYNYWLSVSDVKKLFLIGKKVKIDATFWNPCRVEEVLSYEYQAADKHLMGGVRVNFVSGHHIFCNYLLYLYQRGNAIIL